MNRTPHISISVLIVAVAVLGVGLFLTFSQRSRQNLNRSNSEEFADICDCFVLAGNETGSLFIDSVSGRRYPRVFSPLDPSLVNSRSRFFSPSAASEAVISLDFTKLYIISFPSGAFKLVYHAPRGKVINTVVWSADEHSIIFAQAETKEDFGPADVIPTELVLVNLDTTNSRTILTTDDTRDTKLKSLYPVAATYDAKRVFITSGTLDEPSYYVWNNETRMLTSTPVPVVTGIYAAYARAGDPYGERSQEADGNLLWLTPDGLQALSLYDLSLKTYKLSTWSDSPVSKPSPSGGAVVYLQKSPSGNGGLLTYLDLASGQQKVLSSEPVTSLLGLSSSWWSPDETTFVYAGSVGPSSGYFWVKTNMDGQMPKRVSKKIIPQSFQIENLVPR